MTCFANSLRVSWNIRFLNLKYRNFYKNFKHNLQIFSCKVAAQPKPSQSFFSPVQLQNLISLHRPSPFLYACLNYSSSYCQRVHWFNGSTRSRKSSAFKFINSHSECLTFEGLCHHHFSPTMRSPEGDYDYFISNTLFTLWISAEKDENWIFGAVCECGRKVQSGKISICVSRVIWREGRGVAFKRNNLISQFDMQKTSEILIWICSCLSKYLFYEGNESELNLNPKKIALYNRKLKKRRRQKNCGCDWL